MPSTHTSSFGSEIEGVHLVALSNKTLIIEYEGETQELNIGQTVIVERH